MGGRRELAVLVWHKHTHWLDLTYSDGAPDEMIASPSVAEALAADAGLVPVPTTDGTLRWVRKAG